MWCLTKTYYVSHHQGGDIVSGDGLGSISIYGKYFEDENLEINHTAPGFLGLNDLQTFIIYILG